MQSYLDKTFVIDDPDARVRQDGDLHSFVMEGGNPKRIPKGTEIRVTDAKALDEASVFVNAENFGWTAASNLRNQFLNETLATFEPQDDNQKGANAARDNGHFLLRELKEHNLHVDGIVARAEEADLRLGLGDQYAFHSSGITDADLQTAFSIVQSVLLGWIGSNTQ